MAIAQKYSRVQKKGQVTIPAEMRDRLGLKEGDLVALMTAGAYGATLSSQYNSRPLVAEALVRGDAWARRCADRSQAALCE